jgi:hypothetical protein
MILFWEIPKLGNSSRAVMENPTKNPAKNAVIKNATRPLGFRRPFISLLSICLQFVFFTPSSMRTPAGVTVL